MINSINFKGTYIAPTTVKKFDGNGEYLDKKVALVELSPISDEDMKVMNEISYEWDNHFTFAADIRDRFSDHYVAYNAHPREKFYILTEQEENFEHLDSLDVLATSQVRNTPDGVFVDFLQVAPDYCAGNSKSPFKRIGSAFLDGIKCLYAHKNITLDPLVSVVEFYRKNGFEFFGRHMVYKAK